MCRARRVRAHAERPIRRDRHCRSSSCLPLPSGRAGARDAGTGRRPPGSAGSRTRRSSTRTSRCSSPGATSSTLVFNTLVRLDGTFSVVPELARSWQVSPDGKRVTFQLQRGVKFHDGTDFNADVVKWNIETAS